MIMAAQYGPGSKYTYAPWRESLLIGSLLLTTATQLRLGSVPAGIGELGLVLWLILFVYILSVREYTVNRLFVWYGMFWFISIPSLMLGTVIASELGEVVPMTKYIREMAALAFVTALCLVLTLETGTARDALGRVSRLIRYSGVFTLFVVLFAKFGTDITPITWWLGSRLQGLSANPNQFALLLLPLPFLIAYRVAVTGFSFSYLVVAVLVTGAGLATGSDALILGWIAGCGFILFYYLHRRIASLLLVPAYLLVFATSGTMFLLVLWVLGDVGALNVLARIYSPGTEQYVQSFNRFNLWMNGLVAGQDSPLFGLGPGNHSGFSGPHQDSEAHNSIVDWFTISGLVGVVAFLALFLAQFRLALRSNPWLASAMVVMLVFSSFHYMFRHPLFWFYLIMIGQLSLTGTSINRNITKPARVEH